MKNKKRSSESLRREYNLLIKDGRVDFPPGFDEFRLGQRIYFQVTPSGLLLLDRPRTVHEGRIYSTRVRRCVRTLARFGPRAKGADD